MKKLLLILMLLTFIGAAQADYIPVWPVVRGGTGTTTSTGSGNVVLSASPTITGTLNTSAIFASGNEVISGTTPGLALQATGQTTGNKNWGWAVSGLNFLGQVKDDSFANPAQWLNVTRSGLSISSVVFETGASNTPALSLDSSQNAVVAGSVTASSFSGAGTGLTGTAASLTAGNVTTNANLTGPITSSGNATSIASQSGTGSTFMMTASPTATGTLGAAAISASSTVTGSAFIPSSSAIPTDGLYKPAANTSGIADNSHPVEEYVGVASAVDYMLITNSATGSPGNISYAVTGTDTDIGENHTMKGVGLFTILYMGADSSGNNGPFTVDASGSTLSGNPAFKIVLPASGLHKAFQFSNGTDTTAWASFQFDLGGTGLSGLALGAGGSTTRDLFLYRSAANTLNVATAAGNSSGTLNVGAINGGADLTVTSGNIIAATAGKGLKIKSGSNARIGTGTLTAGTVTIANTSVTANTRVFLTDTSSSTTNVGSLTVSAISANTSFTVTSTLALDTSTFNWMLVESQ